MGNDPVPFESTEETLATFVFSVSGRTRVYIKC